MNFLKKGPEIKLSEIKVPGFVQDIYYDLKDRHLLPLAAVLLLAIVVVPFALSKSSGGEASESPAGSAAETAQSAASAGSSELVAKSAPGLRDYQRRLEHLTKKNPFHQQYRRGEPSSEGSSSSGSSAGGGESSTTVTGTTGEREVTYETGETGGSSGSENGTGKQGKLTWYSYAIDVKVTTGSAEGNSLAVGGNSLSADGGTAGGAPALAKSGRKTQVRNNLPELTMLPSREAPALTYMGSSKDGKKALMLISSDVTGLFGDARCVIGSATCQLLALEVGLPETVVYGGNDRTFKIEVTKIHLVASNKVKKAPLGKPHKHPEG